MIRDSFEAIKRDKGLWIAGGAYVLLFVLAVCQVEKIFTYYFWGFFLPMAVAGALAYITMSFLRSSLDWRHRLSATLSIVVNLLLWYSFSPPIDRLKHIQLKYGFWFFVFWLIVLYGRSRAMKRKSR